MIKAIGTKEFSIGNASGEFTVFYNTDTNRYTCSINVNEGLGYEEEYHTFSSESEAIEWAWDEVEKLGEL